jgi:hypothetical protein
VRRSSGARDSSSASADGSDPRTTADEQERRARLEQRLRQSYIEGAEVDMRRLLGRGLTAEELDRVLRRYPGDLAERRER